MTFTGKIAQWWDSFITALLKPFVRVRQDNYKLKATIEMDRELATQRHIEELLQIQERLAEQNTKIVQESTSTIREWLQGLTQLSGVNIQSPPVVDDEKQWEIEMRNKGLFPETDDMEDFIRKELANL